MDGRTAFVVKLRQLIKNASFMEHWVAFPPLLYCFQNAVRQLDIGFPSYCRRSSFQLRAVYAMRSRVCSQIRLLMTAKGRLCTLLAQRLLCFKGKCDVRDAFRLGISALSRHHFLYDSRPTRGATLVGHSNCVSSVAVHPSAPIMVTGSHDNTA